MVEVDVVGLTACVGCGGSVAIGWLCGVRFVEACFDGRCEVFVGEWCDVFDGCVEPGTSPGAASGMVDTHCSGV